MKYELGAAKLLINCQGKTAAYLWNSITVHRLLLGREEEALQKGKRVSRDGSVYWLEQAGNEALIEPDLDMKFLKRGVMVEGGSVKQLKERLRLKRAEVAELEAALALLETHGDGKK